MCIVPVPVQLYSSMYTGYLVPVPVRSGERRARAFIHTSRINMYPDNTKTGVILD